jgi:DNA-binding response OmpR family regulator
MIFGQAVGYRILLACVRALLRRGGSEPITKLQATTDPDPNDEVYRSGRRSTSKEYALLEYFKKSQSFSPVDDHRACMGYTL